MRKSGLLLLLLVAVLLMAGCSAPEETEQALVASADTITAASGTSYYAGSSYDLDALKEALGAYPYPVSVTVSTVNADGSPNLAVAIPGISEDGKYLTFGLAENRTRENLTERELAVVLFYEYTPEAEKALRNQGCKVVVGYVGDEENKRLNEEAGNENPSLFMEIIEILPIG